MLQRTMSCIVLATTFFLSNAYLPAVYAQPPAVSGLTPDFFPILPWGPMRIKPGATAAREHGLPSIRDCEFTIAGFVQPEDLPECERLGLKAIIAAPRNKPWFGHRAKLTDAQIDAIIRAQVERAGDSPAILGYYIMDEPGSQHFPMLAKAVAAVKKYAPGKLAYINLFPGYATIGAPNKSQLGTKSFTEYLERYVAEVKPQLLSYDNYMVQYSQDLHNTQRAARYYLDLMEVRRVALEHGLDFWNIVSSNQIRPSATPPSVPNLMFQIYTTLAAGGRGVSWFTYYALGFHYAPIDKNGHRTDSWRYLQLVNHHLRTLGPIMNRLTSTGVFYTAPAPVKSLPVLPGRIIKSITARISIGGPVTEALPAMVGEFSDPEGRDYAMIVNLSLQHSAYIEFTTVRSYATKEIYSAEDGRLEQMDEKKGRWLVPGQGILIRLIEKKEGK